MHYSRLAPGDVGPGDPIGHSLDDVSTVVLYTFFVDLTRHCEFHCAHVTLQWHSGLVPANQAGKRGNEAEFETPRV